MSATKNAVETTDVPVPGPFDLAASTRFLEGFTPASRPDAAADPGSLRLAFPASPSWRRVGVRVRQDGDKVTAEGHAEAIPHAVRILSLDVDGSAFAEVGERDSVVADLQRRYPGLRPVLFHSPYEAACWTVIGHRIRIVQAAAIKQRLAAEIGDPVEVAGVTLASFPDPRRLLAARELPGLPPVKVERLHGIAAAALDGALEADRLRAMESARSLMELQKLPGIGPFSAELILIRGAGHPDIFPSAERRLHDSMAKAYDLSNPSANRLATIAEGWRPYRSWVALLIRAHREATTGEISGRSAELSTVAQGSSGADQVHRS